MNRFTYLVSSVGLAAIAAGTSASAQSVRDFQLPPSPDETEEAQGPVDPEAAAPVRPRVIATPTPAPVRRPAPQPQVTQTPLTVPTATPTPSPRPTPTLRPPVQPEERTAPTAAQTGSPAPSQVSPQESVPTETADAPAVSTPSPNAEAPASSTVDVPDTDGEEDTRHWWLLALVGLIAVGAAVLLRRRRGNSSSVPVIQRPKVKRERADAVAEPAAATREPLSVKAEAVKLTLSFANVTLDYRLTLLNRTDRALKDVEIAAKLVSAHNALPMEQQIADAATELPDAAKVERLSPGQSRQIEGKLVLPVGQVYAIRQGNAALMVPILQLRVSAQGIAPLVRSLVVGQAGMGSDRLQPFRLDEGPRSFAPLSQRALD